MAALFYVLLPSAFGTVGLLWQGQAEEARIRRVLLPKEHGAVEAALRQSYPDAQARTCPRLTGLARDLTRFLEGQDVVFSLDVLLRVEHKIPRGRVSTYGRLARHLGSPGAARAAGRALADNPFPLFVPCHRVIRADGDLGGYQGGREMKRALLQMEGLQVTSRHRGRLS